MKTVPRMLGRAWLVVMAMALLLPAGARAETAVQAWVLHDTSGWADALAVDASNNVVAAGWFTSNSRDYQYTTIKYSSAGVALWTNRYNGSGDNAFHPYRVAVDSSNDVIFAGGAWTIKYSGGGVPLWTNVYGPSPRAVAVDSSNSVLVTGSTVSGGTQYNYATIKYSSEGLPLWTNLYSEAEHGPSVARAVALDGSNNVIVTGSSYSSPTNYDADYLTIMYSGSGTPLWTNRYNGPGNDLDDTVAVAVDGNNDVVIAGYSMGCGGYFGYATVKYSNAGVPLWTNRYDGPTNRWAIGGRLALDKSNNVVVAGYSGTSYYDTGWATIKYSSAGVPLWTNFYHGSENSGANAPAIAADPYGNVIVAGTFWPPSPANANAATIKYSSGGVPLWTNRWSGAGNGEAEAWAVAVDHSGNVIVTGESWGSGGTYGLTTLKYICLPDPVMTCLQPTNGTFRLRVDGVLQPGTLVIEAATNLAGWAPVFTNTTSTNVVFYSDPEAGRYGQRFYRAYQFP